MTDASKTILMACRVKYLGREQHEPLLAGPDVESYEALQEDGKTL